MTITSFCAQQTTILLFTSSSSALVADAIGHETTAEPSCRLATTRLKLFPGEVGDVVVRVVRKAV